MASSGYMKKTICIPYEDLSRGGMYTFLRYFKEYLERHQYRLSRNIFSFYDVLFINSFMTPTWKIKLARLMNPKACFVHRIDGSAEDYGRGRPWDLVQGNSNRLMNLTIFQSRYGKHATTEKFKVIDQDGPIIYNPIDTDIFYSTPKKLDKPVVGYVSFSTNPKKGAGVLVELAKSNPQIQFRFIGKFENFDLPNNVELVGPVPNRELPVELNKCNLFCFFSQNETCPNVVLEAMSCGLPILYLDSGGTSELVEDAGEAVTVETFSAGLEKVWGSIGQYSEKARTRAETKFSVDYILSQYVKAIESRR